MKKEFPQKGLDLERIKKSLEVGNNYISEDAVFLGYPQSTPHPLGVEILAKYIQYNENHVGTFTNKNMQLNMTRQLEKELIEMMGQLYGDEDVDGYVTSGGTEGNIMGIWIARNFLEDNVCLIKTDLTHQSVDKACNLMKISEIINIPYTEKFQMNINSLKENILKKFSIGIQKFIIVCTVGYTMTGTIDNVEEINYLLQELEKQYNIKFYIHVDAAIGGLVFPFISDSEFAFKYKYVYSISVDPHKMGYIPFASGIFMCRKGMQKHIEVPIKYAKTVMDKTLISSRSAASAVACWGVFNFLGKNGFKKILQDLIRLKEYLIRKLEEKQLAMVISDPGTNMVCIHFINTNNGLLPEQIEKKYVLDGFYIKYQEEEIVCYKIYIMPHVTKKSLDNFIKDLENTF